MDTQVNTVPDSPDESSSRQEDHIHAELTRLVFRQSYFGIVITVINAAALTFLLWKQVDHHALNYWFSSLLLVAGLRAVLVHQYHYQKVPSHQSKQWGRWNIIGLGTTGVLWGATMIMIFPHDSLTHQLCVALLLCGIVATAISLYAVMPIAVVVFAMPVFLAWIIRFLTFGDTIHSVIAGMAILYMVIMVLTSHHIARTRRQLLIARFNLANRVTERSQELKESNAYLQTEIKERKIIEERLRQERDRLEIITTTIGAGLAVISKKHRPLWVNKIYKQMFGDDVGRTCYQIQSQGGSICEECGAHMVFEQGSRQAVYERECRDVNGKTIWVQVTATPIRNADGRIRAALLMILPITERKEAEAARHRMSAKLEEARKTEAIATLAGGIAHQFNNALAVIAGNIELLEFDHKTDSRISTFSRPILGATRKMTELTSQLLAYAKGGKYKERPDDLSRVVETTLSYIEHTLPKTLSVRKQFDADLPRVKIDTTQIQMVVSSILSNAMEATGPNGRITISCKTASVTLENRTAHHNLPPGQYVSFVTADDGVGMGEEIRQRIFEPFFTTKFEGRGLGMAAVYGIIKNHGGHIQVDSRPDEGTEVRIYLPVVEEYVEPLPETNDTPIHGSGTILMVEDDEDVIMVNQAWLERLGYKVIVATTAHEAIEIISHTHIELDGVLLDMVLPDMSGAAVYPHVREHRPLVKIIITSGYGQDEAIQELLDAGADSFIQKPFTLSEISKKLIAVLPAKKAPAPSSAGDLNRN